MAQIGGASNTPPGISMLVMLCENFVECEVFNGRFVKIGEWKSKLLFVCLFVCLFVYLFVCLFVCLFICLFVCLGFFYC